MEKRFRSVCIVEPLEQRIAPATLSFIDAVDGDTVTITTSNGTDAQLAAIAVLSGPEGAQVLHALNLGDNPVFKGTDLTITATSTTGASTVDIGHIDAAGIDLGTVKIDGDVGQIDAGDKRTGTPAIRSLEVKSIGQRGIETQAAGGSLESRFLGKVDSIKVAEDFAGTFIVSGGKGGVDGRIGSLSIGGSLEGGAGENSGSLLASGKIGDVLVSGNFIGGAGKSSAQIRSGVSIESVEVGGTLQGGNGERSGSIFAAKNLGTVEVHGGLVGGLGAESGAIGSRVLTQVVVESATAGGVAIQGGAGLKSGAVLASANLVDITVNGIIQGGTSGLSGTIASEGTIGKVTVNGSVIGGIGDESGSIGSKKGLGDVIVTGDVKGGDGDRSGRIVSASSLKSVQIGGDLAGGAGLESGAVGATGVVSSVVIQGDLVGSTGVGSALIASGKELPAVQIGGSIIASDAIGTASIVSAGNIGSVSVGGDVGALDAVGLESAQIVAQKNIDQVTIGGTLYGGESGNSGSIRARRSIEQVQIEGDIFGGNGRYSGSIVAGTLGNVSVLGNVTGSLGSDSASFIALTGDIRFLEIRGRLSTGTPPVLTDNGVVPEGGAFRTASIIANRYLGEIAIGDVDSSFLQRVQITAGGVVGATGAQAIAIKSIVVAGNLEGADILAGYDVEGEGVNPDVQIGSVVVGSEDSEQRESGYLRGTNIVAGVLRGEDGIFGTRDDEMITARGASKKTLSTINEIIIHTSTYGFETGFVAEHIKSLVLNGTPEPQLKAGARNDYFTFDVHSGSGTQVSELPPIVRD